MNEKKKEGRKCVFHPHDTATGGLTAWIFVALQKPVPSRIEKEERTTKKVKKEKNGGKTRGRRVRRECSLELEQSQLLHFLSFHLFPSFPFYASPLLDESARRLITQHYPQASATPAFLRPVLLHPFLSSPVSCPTQPKPLTSRPRNIKPTPSHFSLDSMKLSESGNVFIFPSLTSTLFFYSVIFP